MNYSTNNYGRVIHVRAWFTKPPNKTKSDSKPAEIILRRKGKVIKRSKLKVS